MADTRDVFISYARPSEDEAHRIALIDSALKVANDRIDAFPLAL